MNRGMVPLPPIAVFDKSQPYVFPPPKSVLKTTQYEPSIFWFKDNVVLFNNCSAVLIFIDTVGEGVVGIVVEATVCAVCGVDEAVAFSVSFFGLIGGTFTTGRRLGSMRVEVGERVELASLTISG